LDVDGKESLELKSLKSWALAKQLISAPTRSLSV
jgi:hypothetical protein